MSFQFKSNTLYFIPLGGSGEIGMNLNLYRYNDEWVMVDCGISFAELPGCDVIMPDLESFKPFVSKLKGIFITHAHEDHFGAIPYLWSKLRAPIYVSPFAMGLLRLKCKEWSVSPKFIEVHPDVAYQCGAFTCTYTQITHSIPESNVLRLDTPAGHVVHTGDWKFDPHPVESAPTNYTALKKMGESQPLAMVCDSTNVFEIGHSGSERDVHVFLDEFFTTHQKKRIIITSFASNVDRLGTFLKLAKKHGRKAILMGRSLKRVFEVAQSCGYLKEAAQVVEAEKFNFLKPHEVLCIVTGSQGEDRAALSKIAKGEHPHVQACSGDVVLFSARVIPGNDRKIFAIHNALVRQGVSVYTYRQAHVSGHPNRDELAEMYQYVRPISALPVHGEDRHIYEHALLAQSLGVPHTLTPHNGDVIELTHQGAKKVETWKTGRIVLDGYQLIPQNGLVIRQRFKMMTAGIVLVSLNMSKNTLKSYQITLDGVFENLAGPDCQRFESQVHQEILSYVQSGMQPSALTVKIQKYIRHTLSRLVGKKPVVHVHLC